MIKISEKLSNECYYVTLENFKSFHKSRKRQTQQMKSIPKTKISFNFYDLPSSTMLDRKANTTTLNFYYKQLGSSLSPECYLYFQGFWGSKLTK